MAASAIRCFADLHQEVSPIDVAFGIRAAKRTALICPVNEQGRVSKIGQLTREHRVRLAGPSSAEGRERQANSAHRVAAGIDGPNPRQMRITLPIGRRGFRASALDPRSTCTDQRKEVDAFTADDQERS
ncbi:MAG: hypothetical protein JO057_28705, partial [Chloroflexi bacterium]|nr:hypothetical protein [Chloroflexota bacterium]